MQQLSISIYFWILYSAVYMQFTVVLSSFSSLIYIASVHVCID